MFRVSRHNIVEENIASQTDNTPWRSQKEPGLRAAALVFSM